MGEGRAEIETPLWHKASGGGRSGWPHRFTSNRLSWHCAVVRSLSPRRHEQQYTSFPLPSPVGEHHYVRIFLFFEVASSYPSSAGWSRQPRQPRHMRPSPFHLSLRPPLRRTPSCILSTMRHSLDLYASSPWSFLEVHVPHFATVNAESRRCRRRNRRLKARAGGW